MKFLIDGYNLLHAIGFRGDLSAPGNLRRARIDMLDKLSKYLSNEECANTFVIFDAGRRSSEKPQEYTRHLIEVKFSFGFDDADSMIESIIAKQVAPNQWLVVSSDHRIQNAAKRKGCIYVDSDTWIDQLESEFENRKTNSGNNVVKTPRLREDPEYWIELFAIDDINQLMQDVDESERTNKQSQTKDEENLEELDIFPDDYVDDVIEDFDLLD